MNITNRIKRFTLIASNFSAVLILILLSLTANAETYVGTIKDIPIVMELDIYDGQVRGRYFYQKYGKDIPITGSYDEGQMFLIESEERKQGIKMIANDSNNEFQFSGIWFDELKNKTLPITLKYIDKVYNDPNESVVIKSFAEESIYEYLRQRIIKLTQVKSEPFEHFPAMELIWIEDKNSKLQFFTLKANEVFNQVDKINEFLETKFRRYNSAFYEGEVELVVKPNFARSNILSVSMWGTSYYEGAAHPFHISDHYTLHIPSGRLLALEDIISIPEGQKGAWIMAQLLQIAPDMMQSEEACSYMDINTWEIDSYYGWYLSSEGIHLTPEFPHALTPCKFPEWAILPMSLVKQNPGLLPLE